jgi:hypothetical protein
MEKGSLALAIETKHNQHSDRNSTKITRKTNMPLPHHLLLEDIQGCHHLFLFNFYDPHRDKPLVHEQSGANLVCVLFSN